MSRPRTFAPATRRRVPVLLSYRAIFFLIFLIPFLAEAAPEAGSHQDELVNQLPRLSDDARISLITYTPGEELYQAFGHSAIRVRDDFLGMDRLYNFGVFDFETANFYVKFAHGDLLYQLAVSPSEEEIQMVGAYGQGVTELLLNFSPTQRQALFEALEINLLPVNRFYRYDFVLDNCSTRPRDVLERVTGSPIAVPEAGKQTFREMLDPYFTRIPWAGLGVSLLMGAKIDRVPSSREACFLPADLERAVQISKNGEKALTAEKKVIFAPKPLPEYPAFLSPLWVFVGGGAFWFVFWLSRRKGHATAPTAVLLLILGLTGCFILGLSFWARLWVLHDNYNLLWLIPLHFPAGLWLWFAKRRSIFLQWYLWFAFLAATAFLFLAFLLPQKFNVAIYPLLTIVAWRCALEIWPVGVPQQGKDWNRTPAITETGP